MRGTKTDIKLSHATTDMERFKITTLTIQETQLTGSGIRTIKTKFGNNFDLYHGDGDIKDKDGGIGGVGIMVKAGIKVEFKEVTDRICMITTRIEDINHTLICAYAPIMPNSEKKPEIREKFYKDLDSLINGVSKRNILYVAGDFNAKTGSGYKNYPNNVGFYGKDALNSNSHNLVLTDTIFNHKKSHRTTWESPQKTNTNHKNPVRNQMVRNKDRLFVKSSQS